MQNSQSAAFAASVWEVASRLGNNAEAPDHQRRPAAGMSRAASRAASSARAASARPACSGRSKASTARCSSISRRAISPSRAGRRHHPAAHLDGMPGLRGVHRRPEPGAARRAALQPGALCRRSATASATRRARSLRHGLHRLDHRGGAAVLPVVQGPARGASEKTGKPDVRGAYGLHGREMIGWLTHLQHTRARTSGSSGSSTRSSTTSIARSSSRRSTARRPGSSCPGSSTRSSPWRS
jgi:hypothetical protein